MRAQTSLSVEPTWNVSRFLELSGAYELNRIRFPERGQGFDAHVFRIRTQLALNTRVSANAFVQYNSLDDEFSANLRINFIHAPGSDLFLVFNEKRGSDTSVWDFSERGAVVKLTWLRRL